MNRQTFQSSRYLLLLFTIVCSPLLFASSGSGASTGREILILDDQSQPQWKIHWDMGRESARNFDYPGAAELYKLVLKKRPNIEQVRWEYAQIEFKLGQYKEALNLIAGLLESQPNRIDYLLLGGQAALAAGEPTRAVRILEHGYNLSDGDVQIRSEFLEDLIVALFNAGNPREAFPYLEKLYRSNPGDMDVALQLARLAVDLQKSDKAEFYYETAIDADPNNIELIEETASFYNTSDQKEKAAPLWEKMLATQPGNIDYHQSLFEHYQEKEHLDAALPHLLALVEDKSANDPRLLLETARIYHQENNRTELALAYYERYLLLRPWDQKVQAEATQARNTVAAKFLSDLDKGKGKNVWRKVATITSDEASLYQAMVDQLSHQHSRATTIDVLERYYQKQDIKDEAVRLKLARLYENSGKAGKAYQSLLAISDENLKGKPYYLSLAELEIKLGYDFQSFSSLLHALTLAPDDLGLRIRCIKLAGELGLVDNLAILTQPLIKRHPEPEYFDSYIAYIDALYGNGLYDEAIELLQQLQLTASLTSTQKDVIVLYEAKSLLARGESFRAEEVVRRYMTLEESPGNDLVAFLVELLINQGDLSGAREVERVLILPLQEKSHVNQEAQTWAEVELTFAGAKILEAAGEGEKAIELLQGVYRDNYSSSEIEKREAAIEMCRLHLELGERNKCRNIIRKLPLGESYLPQWHLIKYIASSDDELNVDALATPYPAWREGNGGYLALKTMAETAMQFGEYDGAMRIYESLYERFPDSKLVQVELANSAHRAGNTRITLNTLKSLLRSFPHEQWIIAKYLTIRFNLGDFDGVLRKLSEIDSSSTEFQLLYARSLYGLEEYDQAFLRYDALMSPSVNQLFKERLNTIDSYAADSDDAASLTKSFNDVFGVAELEMLSEIEGEAGFLANRLTAAGKISTELYSQYRWQQRIETEYNARKALAENQYSVAEREYRTIDKRKRSSEELKDLAKIYERLGQYDKEAEIYTYLDSNVEHSPELEASIERNRIATAPTLGVVYDLVDKDGRRGFYNMNRQAAGIDFQYLPTVNSSLTLQYREVSYEPSKGEGSGVDGRIFSLEGVYRYSPDLTFDYELGLHMLDSDSDSSFFSLLRGEYQFAPNLSGYLLYSQELVEDNFTSLDKGLITNSVSGGMVFENTLGISLGTEYRRLWHEDDNNQNRVNLWAGYTHYEELVSYSFEYRYEHLKNDKDDVEDSLVYWSPENFWRHQIKTTIEYLLKDTEEVGRPPSTLSANLVFGYEEEEDLTVGGGADIFLEIGSNFLVKGSIAYTEGDDYQEESASLSLVYRW